MSLEKHKPVEQKPSDADLLSNALHGNVYPVPADLKKWFSYKGEKIYSQGRDKYLNPNVVTWEEARDGGQSFQCDAYDKAMLDELRKYCYNQRFKSKVANPEILDESTGKSYPIPAPLKQWFNQNRLAVEDSSANNDTRTSELQEYTSRVEPGDYGNTSIPTDSDSAYERRRPLYALQKRKFDRSYMEHNTTESEPRVYGYYSNQLRSTDSDSDSDERRRAWYEAQRPKLDESEPKLHGTEKINGVVTLKQLHNFYDDSPSNSDNQKKMIQLEDYLYRQRFKSKISQAIVIGDDNFVYHVPKDYTKWFDQNRINIEKAGKGDPDGTITTQELSAYRHASPSGSDNQKKINSLNHSFYNNRFQSTLADTTVLGDNGFVHKVPARLQSWFKQRRIDFDNAKSTQVDGKITTDELKAYYKDTANDDERNHSRELLKACYDQKFKQVNLIDARKETPYTLPANLQKWLNKNAWEIDMMDYSGMNGTGAVTMEDLETNESVLPSDSLRMISELKTFVGNTISDDQKAITRAFETQVSQDPQSLKTWFDKHKSAIDRNKDTQITFSELLDYAENNKLNGYDKQMTLGLASHIGTFNKLTDHPNIQETYRGSNTFLTSEDINTAVQLALHKAIPAQIALENLLDQTKQGATYGAAGGAAFSLLKNAGNAIKVVSSWGLSSTGAAAAIGSTMRATLGASITGAVAGAAIAAGVCYGMNYYNAHNRVSSKSNLLRDAHLMS